MKRRFHAKRFFAAKEILPNVLKGCNLWDKFIQFQAVINWPKVVGEKIALHSKAFDIKRNILYVQVDSYEWRTELCYLKEEIIKKINEEIGKPVVSDIKFRVISYD